MLNNTKVLGTGLAVPEKVLTNSDLEKMVETNDQWIVERTGIQERRISSKEGGEWSSDLAVKATQEALKAANIEANDIDLILMCTLSPDFKLPNTASVIQQKLGMTNNCACLDIAAACTGFVYGFNMADALIKVGQAKTILVIGSEVTSRDIDWSDRNTCILFGDGCGVALLGKADEEDSSEVLSHILGSDGSGAEFFHQYIGGAVTPVDHHHLNEGSQFMQMKGKEMFKVATRTLAQSAKDVLAKAGMTIDDVDWLVPHQANIRIIETTGKLLGIPSEKVITNIHKYGNTSAATVPMAFHEAIVEGKIKRGDIVLFDAFGAGLTYGATLFRY